MPSSLPFLPTPHLRKSVLVKSSTGCAFERIDGDDGHLNAGGLFDTAAVFFQLRARLRVEHMREVADVALGLERIGVEGKQRAGQ